MVTQLDFLVRTATDVFGEDSPLYRNIPLPKPLNAFANISNQYFKTPALWTRDGLRPRWDNLAAIANQLEEPIKENLLSWQAVVNDLKIPLIVLSSNNHYLLISSDRVEPREATQEQLRQQLKEQRRRLFSPRSLSRLRSGQLSFADLEESLDEDSFTFHLRHRGQLDRALTEGVKGAIEAQLQAAPSNSRKSTVDSVMVTAVAYLAARILDDKGFFGDQPLLIDDPKELLEKTMGRTDGFFTQAYYDHLPHLDITALQKLALFIGNSVSFTLVDDQDVGRLYEQAMQVTQQYMDTSTSTASSSTFSDLQQHYTPQAVAERMLDLLPLELFPPDERAIFDPAAGSGSLLLAATRRLALMPDVALLSDSTNYLAQHVIGNDRDPNAKLLTKLRYTLVQETFGQQELFPDPEYSKGDYHEANAWTLPLRQRIVIANPPFAEDGDIQRAVRFIQVVTEQMQEGDQFAIVLPQTFLTGSTHGFPAARMSLSEKCHILESWQLPEGAIGFSAQQPVCIILGIAGKRKSKGTIARAVITRSQIDTIRNKGFLGQSWITETKTRTSNWRTMVAPPVHVRVTTIPLDNLFDVCTGIGTRKDMPPISDVPGGVPVKSYWKHGWRKPGTLWVNPDWIPPEQRYIRFGREYLEGHRASKEWVFDSQKIMVSRSTNRNSLDPLAACLDTIGLCPTKNIFCIVPLSPSNTVQSKHRILEEWTGLNYKQKLSWLLGILSSPLAVELLMSGRATRHLNSDSLKNFPLPRKVDVEIINLVNRIVQGEMEHKPVTELETLRELLNKTVEASYGNPERSITLTRTGVPPDLEFWKQERKQPSFTVTGQVLDFDISSNKVYLYLDSLLDEEQEAWVSLPQELPGWALNGTVFEAQLSRTVETFDDLDRRPWALRNFKHTPRPYLTLEELQDRLLSKLGNRS